MSKSPNLVVISRRGDDIAYTRFVGRTLADQFILSGPLAADQVEAMRHDPKQFEEAYQAVDPDAPAAA